MIVTADWVLPVSRPLIRDGAVVVRRSRIVAVGDARTILAEHPDEEVTRFDGCVLTPGLVNARTHLALSALREVPRDASVPARLHAADAHLREFGDDDVADSAALGATQCLATGTTVVGDVAYGPESPAAAADAGLAGVFFWEVLGISQYELAEYLAEREYPTGGPTGHGRIRCAVGPHSVYTCGPSLLRSVRALARDQACPFALRVAESAAENLLLAGGGGPLEPVARDLAFRFHAPRASTVDYLDSLNVLDGAIAIHCTHTDARDVRRLAARTAGVVLCPRSNQRLGHDAPPAEDLLQAGARLALGTDSTAALDDADLFAEARALRRLAPSLSAERTLRIMTFGGAWVLGMADLFGALDPGKQADLVAVETGVTDDPAEAFLDAGAGGGVRSVISGGVWRVIDGEPVYDVRSIQTAGARVARKAEAMAGPVRAS